MFARAAPPGSRLLAVAEPGGPVKVWATQSADGGPTSSLINKSPTTAQTVQIHMPTAPPARALEWLQAPSATATTGVTLGGQSFGNATSTGELGADAPHGAAGSFLGAYLRSTLPPASAVILTQR